MMRPGLLLAVMVSAFALLAPAAGAHAVLAHSSPADGSTLARAPGEVRLSFSEAISPRFRVVRVIDGRGRVVRGVRVRGAGARGLVASVPRLRHGAYEITWEVLAAADGHVTGGALAFGVQTKPLAARDAGGPGAGAPPSEALARWLDVALLA